jgi:H+-transporting ATPase
MTDSRSVAATLSRFCAKPPGSSFQLMVGLQRRASNTAAGVIMRIGELALSTAVLVFGAYRLGFGIETLRTLAFVAIVFGNQATTYTNRERRNLWSSHPGGWVVASSIGDLLIASTPAIGGIAMARLPALTALGVLAAAIVFAIVLDLAKVSVFNRLGIA